MSTADVTRPAEPPPQSVMMRFMYGLMVAKSLQAVAELSIADLLHARGPQTADALAAATGMHGPSLFRLLRGLAAYGVFRQRDDGTFENTPLSEVLRRDAPHSVRDYVRYAMHEGNIAAWGRLPEALRTGEPQFQNATGMNFWQFLQAHPDIAERFNGAMTGMSRATVPLLLAHCDFSRFRRVIDVGGGQGFLLADVLTVHRHLAGTLFDLPAVIDSAKVFLGSRGLAERCTLVGGSFFHTIPGGHDCYMMKHVLHDWDDAACVKILSNCRAAMPADATLVIFDAVMQSGNEPHPAKWADLHMMVALGGRERTAAEFEALLAQSGFRMTRATPLPIPVGVVEAAPV